MALLALGTLACARSELELGRLGPGGIGIGGTTTSSAGGAAGSGGHGGGGGAGGGGGVAGSWACEALVVTGELRQLGPTVNPSMFGSSADGSRVTVAAHMNLVYGFPPLTNVHHTSFEPWGAWPSQDPSQGFLVQPLGREELAAAPMDDGSFALLYGVDTPNGPSPARLAPRVPIAAQGTGPVELPLTSGPSSPRFLAHDGGTAHFFGVAEPGTSSVALLGGWTDTPPGGTPLWIDKTVGCADDRVVADAVFVAPDRWVLAVAAPIQDCAPNLAPAAGSRRWLTTSVFHGFAGPQSPGVEWFAGQSVEGLDLAPGPGKIWLSFRRAGGPIEVAALSSNGTQEAEPVSITHPDEEPFEHAITAFGPGAAIAFVDRAPEHYRVVVRVLDAQATPVATLALPSPDEFPNAGAWGRPAIIASPSGDALLVAWTDWNGYNDAAVEGHVVRLECGSP